MSNTSTWSFLHTVMLPGEFEVLHDPPRPRQTKFTAPHVISDTIKTPEGFKGQQDNNTELAVALVIYLYGFIYYMINHFKVKKIKKLINNSKFELTVSE